MLSQKVKSMFAWLKLTEHSKHSHVMLLVEIIWEYVSEDVPSHFVCVQVLHKSHCKTFCLANTFLLQILQGNFKWDDVLVPLVMLLIICSI